MKHSLNNDFEQCLLHLSDMIDCISPLLEKVNAISLDVEHGVEGSWITAEAELQEIQVTLKRANNLLGLVINGCKENYVNNREKREGEGGNWQKDKNAYQETIHHYTELIARYDRGKTVAETAVDDFLISSSQLLLR